MELTGSVNGLIKLLGGGSDVTIEPILLDGVEIMEITVDGVVYYIYAPEPGDDVSVTPIQLTGTKIATITIGENSYDIYSPTITPGDSVNVTPIQSTGTKIATISVNDVPVDIYAPSNGGSVYSTTEQVIGEWIDGRPLYQFVGITNGSVTLDNYDYRTIPLSYLPQNIDMLISAVITRETPNVGGNIRFYASNGNITGASLNQYNLSSGMMIIFTFVKSS